MSIMNKKFLSNIDLTISFIVIVLFFGLLSCNSSKKEEKECAYTNIEGEDNFDVGETLELDLDFYGSLNLLTTI